LTAVEADLDRLVQRLRGLSPSAWRSRQDVVDDLLSDLEQVTANLERRPSRPIPALPDYAKADAVAVLGADAVAGIVDSDESSRLDELARLVGQALARTR
jgi:hypothetical protein